MVNSLTSFRFITALVVFLFHCNIHLDLDLGIKIFDKFFLHGAVFMTAFFVLSGFIMTHVYQNWDFSKQGNVFEYYVKRFAKIYPVYMMATLVFFISFDEGYSNRQWGQIMLNGLFLTQGFFPSMFNLGLNGATWSLSVEMFLYALFPFLLLVSGKSPKILWVALVLTGIVMLNVTLDNEAYTYANPVMRLGDFMAGMGFYALKDKPLFKKAWFHIGIVVLLLFATAFISTNRYITWSSLNKYMAWHTLAVFLLAAWITCVYHSKAAIYNNRAMVYCGLISYSFYIWQFLAILAGKSFLQYGGFAASGVALGLNLALSVLSYHLLEEPARGQILRLWKKRKTWLNAA